MERLGIIKLSTSDKAQYTTNENLHIMTHMGKINDTPKNVATISDATH